LNRVGIEGMVIIFLFAFSVEDCFKFVGDGEANVLDD